MILTLAKFEAFRFHVNFFLNFVGIYAVARKEIESAVQDAGES